MEAADECLKWDADAAATGVYSARGFDGREYKNTHRASLAGKPLIITPSGCQIRFALVELRETLSELFVMHTLLRCRVGNKIAL